MQMFKPKAWSTAGINMKKGLVFFIREDQKMLYLESSTPENLEKALAKLVARLDGATKRVDSDHNGTRVVTLGRPFGAEVVPVLHYAQSGSTFYWLSVVTHLEWLKRSRSHEMPRSTGSMMHWCSV